MNDMPDRIWLALYPEPGQLEWRVFVKAGPPEAEYIHLAALPKLIEQALLTLGDVAPEGETSWDEAELAALIVEAMDHD